MGETNESTHIHTSEVPQCVDTITFYILYSNFVTITTHTKKPETNPRLLHQPIKLLKQRRDIVNYREFVEMYHQNLGY